MADPRLTPAQLAHADRNAAAARDNAEAVLTLIRDTLNRPDGPKWTDPELIVACAGRTRQRLSLVASDHMQADALAYVAAYLATRLIRAEQQPASHGYVGLCHDLAALADKTMRLAQYSSAAGAHPVHVHDLEEAARAMLALVPDTPPTRTWSLPPEPGPDVLAVRCDCCGFTWTRDHGPPGCPDIWIPDGALLRAKEWRPLVIDHTVGGSKLHDVTGEPR